jgi:hypothetical protein
MRLLAALTLAASLVANVAVVRADDSPWSQGVSDSEQAAATELFSQGNKYMDEAFWKEASKTYREALKHWDNPAIRGNLAICLLNLDQPVEGYAQMKEALRHGEAPFSAAAYRSLLSSSQLLKSQIAELQFTSTSGTRILLDGKVQSAGAKSAPIIMRPGQYRVEGYRDGHISRNEMINVLPGQHHLVPVNLDSIADATSYHRKWKPWKTWAVAGSAGALALGSTILLVQARTDRNDYTRAVDSWCAPNGCIPGGGDGEIALPTSFTKTKDRANTLQTLGVATGAVSGVVGIGALVMWAYNRPERRVRVRYDNALPVQLSLTPQKGGALFISKVVF